MQSVFPPDAMLVSCLVLNLIPAKTAWPNRNMAHTRYMEIPGTSIESPFQELHAHMSGVAVRGV